MRRRRLGAMGCSLLLILAPFGASASRLTLFVDGAPSAGADLPARVGEAFEVAVGLDDVLEVQQYNLDIRFDEAELSLTGAEQLACLSFASGTCTADFPFVIDPTDPGSATVGRRAAVLTTPPGFFTIDPTATGNPFAAFFSLTFEVLPGLDRDGSADVTIGILTDAANEITDRNGMSLEMALADTNGATVSFEVVPEPSVCHLLLAIGAAIRIAGRGRRQEPPVGVASPTQRPCIRC